MIKNNRYLTTLGYYVPSFYRMFIGDGIDKFDVNTLKDHDLSVFFHEYIHFLQDLTTFDGVNRSYCFNELMKSLLQVVYADKKGTKVPISLDRIDERVLLQQKIVEATSGASMCIPKCNVVRYKTANRQLKVGNLSLDIPIEKLCLDDFVCYRFGSASIQESMAYLMQKQCTQIDYTSPDAPYNIATQLAYNISPEVFSDKIKIVALCDASLMSNAPGFVFCNVAQQCKTCPEKFKTPESIIDFILKLEGQDHFTNQKKTIGQFYFDKIEIIKRQLCDYIQTGAIDFSGAFDKCISLAIDYRRKNPYFMVDIAKGGNIKRNEAFLKVLSEFGSPVITNNQGKYYQYPSSKFDNRFMTSFSAILQLFELLSRGEIPCKMKNWCLSSSLRVDSRCENTPWQHYIDKQLCPFAFLWKHYDLSDYNPL